MNKRTGVEIKTAIPGEYGRAVSMCTFKGRVLIAFEYAICEIVGRKVKKLQFEQTQKQEVSGQYQSAFDCLKLGERIVPLTIKQIIKNHKIVKNSRTDSVNQ